MSKIRRIPFKTPFTPNFQTPRLKPNNHASLSISSSVSTASGYSGQQARFKLYTFVESPGTKIQKTTSSGQLSDHEIRVKATGVSTNRSKPKKSFKSPLIPVMRNSGKDDMKRILDDIFPSPPKAKQRHRNLAYEIKQDVLKTIYKMKQELEEIRKRRQKLFIGSSFLKVACAAIPTPEKSTKMDLKKASVLATPVTLNANGFADNKNNKPL